MSPSCTGRGTATASGLQFPRMALIVGVAGGSGSGKTTVVARVKEMLGEARVAVIEHDRYYRHRHELAPDARAALNYDHPDALETRLLVDHLVALKSGRPVHVPVYDFTRHLRLAATDLVLPRPIVVVEGILVLADAALRALCDVKIFVDTSEDERFRRRVDRDTNERGRSAASVAEQFRTTVQPMHEAFVEPSRTCADIIVQDGGHNRLAIDVVAARIRAAAPPVHE